MSLKIVWPVDLFTDGDPLQRTTAKAIRALTRRVRAVEIQPVYLYGSYAIDLTGQERGKVSAFFYESAARKFAKLIKGVQLKGLLPVKLMGLPYPTMRESTGEVLAFARRWKANLIVVGTHSRTGAKRWLMGSFSETLSLHSEIPLIVVNPYQENPSVRKILFPTDFSQASHNVLGLVMDWAKIWRSSITVFHRVPTDTNPGIESAFGTYGVFQDFFSERLGIARKEGKAWLARLKERGISARLIIDQKSRGSVAEAITQTAKKMGGLIAIAGQGGAVSSVLLGSITRQVLRESLIPVWIVHYSDKKLPKRGQLIRKTKVPLLGRAKHPHHVVKRLPVHPAHLD